MGSALPDEWMPVRPLGLAALGQHTNAETTIKYAAFTLDDDRRS